MTDEKEIDDIVSPICQIDIKSISDPYGDTWETEILRLNVRTQTVSYLSEFSCWHLESMIQDQI
jgi:hypothetical protein